MAIKANRSLRRAYHDRTVGGPDTWGKAPHPLSQNPILTL
jgi:hypothetical protein